MINQVFAGLAKIKKLWVSSPQLSPELLQELARLSGLEPPNYGRGTGSPWQCRTSMNISWL